MIMIWILTNKKMRRVGEMLKRQTDDLFICPKNISAMEFLKRGLFPEFFFQDSHTHLANSDASVLPFDQINSIILLQLKQML